MGFIKRAALSVARRPGKSLVMFLVVLILGSLMSGMAAVRQAVADSEQAAKLSLGATVSIGLDQEPYIAAKQGGKAIDFHYLSSALIEELGRRPEVRSFDYTQTCGLGSRTLKNFEVEGSEGTTTSYAGYETDLSGAFTLRGTRYAPVMPVEAGRLSLVEGRVFTDEEVAQGRLVALVSNKVAELNNLHVGDTAVLVNEIREMWTGTGELVESRDLALEVIGVFSYRGGAEGGAAEGEGGAAGGASGGVKAAQALDYDLYNSVYVPIKVTQAEDLFQSEGMYQLGRESGMDIPADQYEPYYTPLYILSSMDDLASFTAAAEAVLPEYYAVLSAQSQYEQVAGPMMEIQRVMAVSLLASAAAALLVLSLITVLFLRDRRKEFGVYLSLGVRRTAIVGQVLVEVLAVAAAALVVSLFVGGLVADGISQQALAGQAGFVQGPNEGIYVSESSDAGLMMGSVTPEELVAGFGTGASLPFALAFLGLGLSVAAASCAAPLLYVLRLRPKKILM
jgi:putative ABC transport system permease protein